VSREVQISYDAVVRACEIEPVLSGAHPVGSRRGGLPDVGVQFAVTPDNCGVLHLQIPKRD
jgi:hypothetical protein